MKSKKNEPLSWTLLFLTTGLCFLIFSGFLKLITDGKALLFFAIGFALLITGIIKLFIQKNTLINKERNKFLPKRDSNRVVDL